MLLRIISGCIGIALIDQSLKYCIGPECKKVYLGMVDFGMYLITGNYVQSKEVKNTMDTRSWYRKN